MRHRKSSNQLGVKKSHRILLIRNLSISLLQYGRIKTTLKKAKALRPFIEKIITLIIKVYSEQDKHKKLHYQRLIINKIRDYRIINSFLSNEKRIQDLSQKPGGYTRIYKLHPPRLGDSAPLALIEFTC